MQCGFVGGFLPNFAIFALVSVHLGKFGLSSLASIGNSNAFLCQLSLPIHLYLSPLVMQFMNSVSQPNMAATNWVVIWPWGSELQPTFSGGFCSVCFGGITSVAEVLSLLFFLLLRVLSALAEPPWCVSSANLGTPAVSTRCLAAGCPSGVPLLATLFRMADRPGSAPLPPVSSWL